MKIVGTNDRDILQDKIGTDDFIFGFAGSDDLEDDLQPGFTPSSDDMYFGGSGKDSIFSIYGSDHLYGQRGNDSMDVMKGGEKRVVVDGGQGHDIVSLWDFDPDRTEIKEHDRRTVVEQGDTKVVIHIDVEKWEFV